MKSFIFIVLIWVLKESSSLPVSNDSLVVEPGQYPYHGIVTIDLNGEPYPICEGIVIDEWHFLTAAGCVYKYESSPESLEIVVGATSIKELESDENVQIVKVSNCNFPKEWTDSEHQTGDVAILTISEKLNVNTYVSPILNTFEEISDVDKDYNLVSYGDEDELMSVPVKILSKEECEDNYYIRLSSGTFCAERIDGSYLAGTVYTGASFADQNDTLKNVYAIHGSSQSNVFIELAPYKNWIKEVTDVPMENASLPSADDSEDAKSRLYPYHGMVAIELYGEPYPICEGIVIDEWHFLTAAGCVQKYESSPESLEIVVGATSIQELQSDKNVQIVKVSNFNFPKEWTDSEHQNGDLVVIKVSEKLDVNNYVSPILNTFDEISDVDKNYNFVGFGSEDELTSIPVKKLSKEECEDKYWISLSKGTFCAATEDGGLLESTAYIGASFADQNDTLKCVYAIYSYVRTGAFIELAPYKSWIEEVIGAH